MLAAVQGAQHINYNFAAVGAARADTENWLAGFLCLALTLIAWKRCTCRQAARDCQLGW